MTSMQLFRHGRELTPEYDSRTLLDMDMHTVGWAVLCCTYSSNQYPSCSDSA